MRKGFSYLLCLCLLGIVLLLSGCDVWDFMEGNVPTMPPYTPYRSPTPTITLTPTSRVAMYEDELDDADTAYVDMGKVEAIPGEDSSIQLVITFPRTDDLQSQILADPYWVSIVIFGEADWISEYGYFGMGICQNVCWSWEGKLECNWGIRQDNEYVPWEDVILPSFDTNAFTLVFNVPDVCQGLPWGIVVQIPTESDEVGLEGPEPFFLYPRIDL